MNKQECIGTHDLIFTRRFYQSSTKFYNLMVLNWNIWLSELNQKGFLFFRVTYNTKRD